LYIFSFHHTLNPTQCLEHFGKSTEHSVSKELSKDLATFHFSMPNLKMDI